MQRTIKLANYTCSEWEWVVRSRNVISISSFKNRWRCCLSRAVMSATKLAFAWSTFKLLKIDPINNSTLNYIDWKLYASLVVVFGRLMEICMRQTQTTPATRSLAHTRGLPEHSGAEQHIVSYRVCFSVPFFFSCVFKTNIKRKFIDKYNAV